MIDIWSIFINFINIPCEVMYIKATNKKINYLTHLPQFLYLFHSLLKSLWDNKTFIYVFLCSLNLCFLLSYTEKEMCFSIGAIASAIQNSFVWANKSQIWTTETFDRQIRPKLPCIQWKTVVISYKWYLIFIIIIHMRLLRVWIRYVCTNNYYLIHNSTFELF